MATAHDPPSRVLIVMPNRLPLAVMATPTLRALRRLWPGAHLAALMREDLAPAFDPMPWVDAWLDDPRGRHRGGFGFARRLSRMRFEVAVLLPNSFRAAALAAMSGIPRRVGYERDGRGVLLTDRLLARRAQGRYLPVPMVDYYLGVARYLGAEHPDPSLELFVSSDDQAAAGIMLQRLGHGDDAAGPLVLMAPGCAGAGRRWPAARFAELARRLHTMRGASVALIGEADDAEALDAVRAEAVTPLLNLPPEAATMPVFKAVCRRAGLLVTGDTGPGEVAVAVGTPVVRLAGSGCPVAGRLDRRMQRSVVAPGGDGHGIEGVEFDSVWAATESLLGPVPAVIRP